MQPRINSIVRLGDFLEHTVINLPAGNVQQQRARRRKRGAGAQEGYSYEVIPVKRIRGRRCQRRWRSSPAGRDLNEDVTSNELYAPIVVGAFVPQRKSNSPDDHLVVDLTKSVSSCLVLSSLHLRSRPAGETYLKRPSSSPLTPTTGGPHVP